VAKDISGRIGAIEDEVFQYLLAEYRTNGRGRIFNAAMKQYGMDDSSELVDALVQLYRRHPAEIALYPGVEELLKQLKKKYRLAIVTDGAVEIQSNKIRALRLRQMVDHVIYCWEIGFPKPDPKGYARALERFSILPHEAMVIGDHPLNDIYAGKQIGALTARVRTGRFGNLPNIETAIPDYDLMSITHMAHILV
jgi:putative hydrolase of the HAD superfamily